MADLRTARRTAEKLAHAALSGTLLGAAGELGVALASRAEAAEAIATAAERAREIVRATEAEAVAVVARARQEATEADTGYAAALRATTTAGWAPAQLRGMCYPPPPAPGTARRAGKRARRGDADPSPIAAAS